MRGDFAVRTPPYGSENHKAGLSVLRSGVALTEAPYSGASFY